MLEYTLVIVAGILATFAMAMLMYVVHFFGFANGPANGPCKDFTKEACSNDMGARLFVAGSAVFGADEPAAAYAAIAEAAGAS